MQLALFLINYLAKVNNVSVQVCKTSEECFAAYRELISKTDVDRLNAAYLKSEETYLKSHLADMGIISLDDFAYKLSCTDVSATALSADLLVNPVGNTAREIYLYGGSRMKKTCADINGDIVTEGFALSYKKIFSTPSPEITNKLTSADILRIREIYNAAADYAVKSNLESIVFLPVVTADKLLNKRLLKIAADTVEARDDLKCVKKVFAVAENQF